MRWPLFECISIRRFVVVVVLFLLLLLVNHLNLKVRFFFCYFISIHLAFIPVFIEIFSLNHTVCIGYDFHVFCIPRSFLLSLHSYSLYRNGLIIVCVYMRRFWRYLYVYKHNFQDLLLKFYSQIIPWSCVPNNLDSHKFSQNNTYIFFLPWIFFIQVTWINKRRENKMEIFSFHSSQSHKLSQSFSNFDARLMQSDWCTVFAKNVNWMLWSTFHRV